MKQLEHNALIIGPCRLSYMHGFTPRKVKKEDGTSAKEYSVLLLIPKEASDFNAAPNAELEGLSALIREMKDENFPKAKKWSNPIKDGDFADSDAQPLMPGYWCVSAKSQESFPPKMLDPTNRPASSEDWRSGDWAYAKVRLYPWTNEKQGVGVSLSLAALKFTGHDVPFGFANDMDTVQTEFEDLS